MWRGAAGQISGLLSWVPPEVEEEINTIEKNWKYDSPR